MIFLEAGNIFLGMPNGLLGCTHIFLGVKSSLWEFTMICQEYAMILELARG